MLQWPIKRFVFAGGIVMGKEGGKDEASHV